MFKSPMLLQRTANKVFQKQCCKKCGNLERMPCFPGTGFSVESIYFEFLVLKSLFFIRQAAAVIQKLIVEICLADTYSHSFTVINASNNLGCNK